MPEEEEVEPSESDQDAAGDGAGEDETEGGEAAQDGPASGEGSPTEDTSKPVRARKERVSRDKDAEEEATAVKVTPSGKPAPKPMGWKTMVYAMLATAIIFMMFDPGSRQICGLSLDLALEPTIGLNGQMPVFTFFLAGSLMAVFSMTVRQFVTDWVDMARIQSLSRWMNKIRMEAFRSRNPQRMERATQIGNKHSSEMMKMTKSNFKVMGLTMLPVLAMFAWLSVFVSPPAYHAPTYPFFSVPWAEEVHLNQNVLFPAWFLLYGLVSLPVSMVLQKVIKYVSFKRRLEALENGEEEAD